MFAESDSRVQIISLERLERAIARDAAKTDAAAMVKRVGVELVDMLGDMNATRAQIVCHAQLKPCEDNLITFLTQLPSVSTKCLFDGLFCYTGVVHTGEKEFAFRFVDGSPYNETEINFTRL
jgi:hypothetical protein